MLFFRPRRLLTARPRTAPVVDVLAGLLVLLALLLPNQTGRLSPGAFLRLPVEALLAVAVLLALPGRFRRPAALVGGAVLGLLTVATVLDMGFFSVLARPFDPVLDWALVGNAREFLTSSIGRTGAVAVLAGVAVIALAVPALLGWAALRLTRLVVRHDGRATAGLAGAAVVWLTCAGLGVQVGPGEPVAARTTLTLARERALGVQAGLRDQRAFAAEAGVDRFRDTPADGLLTGLRGKDVVVAFVESYGRDAVENPEFAPQVGAVLDDGTRRLAAAGYSSRSAFLTSSTAGGGSWLAHATLLSGLWITNEKRYRNLVASDRLTLNGAFRRAGWRTVGVMPGVTRAWPEGAFYGYDQLYDSRTLGYRGPHFSWAPMPDQYALAAFQRAERTPGADGPDGSVVAAGPRAGTGDGAARVPVMAEIPLVSSHGPWAPLPHLVDWDAVGDGSVFDPMPAAGDRPDDVWKDPSRVRAAYRQSVEYSLGTLVSYVERYGDDDLVLVFLGDHQPAPLITGPGASRDVPVTIVARDPAVLDRISGWGWNDGLRPDPQAPVWRMDTFRDRFLTAFGPR